MRLEIKDLHVFYGKIEAIKGISVVVNQGEIVTLIGANGAGKTTTLKTVSGLRPVSSGAIIFDGQDISGMSAHERVEIGISQAGGTLSGGEQQMLAIGRALMARPKVLLLDEPSMGLAPMMIQNIFNIITEINTALGTTILLVEQNAQQALQRAHRAYVLETGKVVKEAKASDLLNDPAVREAYLGTGAHS